MSFCYRQLIGTRRAMQQQASSSSPHSSPTPNASDAVLIPDRILAEGSIELSEAGHEGRSSERKGKPKPDLRPGLRMLFSKPVWQQEFKRKWQRVAPKVLWSLIVQERCTITVSAVFAAGLVALWLTAWRDLSGDAWFTVWATFVSLVPMMRGSVDPDVCLFFNATLLLLRGIITPKDAFEGLCNESIVAIALMMALAAGLESTGALEYVPELVMGRSKREWVGQLRLFVAVSSVSAFMNNTPLVAVMIPVVEQWCRYTGHPVSRFMMPLSYAAILGGLCTVIGTSTNLIARGLAQQDLPTLRIPFFEVGIIGLPLTVAGGIYVVCLGRWLLPRRDTLMASVTSDPREYVVSVKVDARYAHLGRTIEAAGLRHLRGLFLADLQRADGITVPSPPPTTIILLGDTLTFAGDITGMQHILTMPGLQPISSADLASDLEDSAVQHVQDRVMVEAVVSLSSPIVNMTIRDSHFRSRYGAVVLAVHRNGERVTGGLGDIVVKGGDTMLLEAGPDFLERYKHSSEWALAVDAFRVGGPRKEPMALLLSIGLFITMVVLNSVELLALSTTALVCLLAYLAFGILTVQQFRSSIPGMVLLTVAGAFGVARAMTVTGLAERIATSLLSVFHWMGRAGPTTSVYVATVLLTALLSNGASVTLMWPVARDLARQAHINVKGPLYAIMIGASSDFSTPIGYQTNLMVSGPGGYRFLDYTRFGLPLQIIVAFITVPICVLYFDKQT